LVELVQVDRRSRINREEQLLNQHETIHTMVRGFAHEIRNPLGGLRGAAQLLERELDDPVLEEYTNVIIDEADRLQSLLDRMMGPRTLPEKRMINIHEVTDRVCKLVQSEAPEGVRINCDYDPSIPETSVDSDMLIQALLNIARNAVQAVQRIGHITVRSRIQRQFTIGSRHHRLVVRLDIIDDGPGVTPEMVEKIFYPMVSGRPGGSGLGLSIAQNLIHRHGGIIQCTSRPGETVMTTILPLESSP
ncbi:MAG: PAS domain-containing sensor histidine kinase, partial [Gammaproteobacteria bacterium]|nr:PAS domain-containing sensor histidine kinase [Gammaproteobacteria bacterium]